MTPALPAAVLGLGVPVGGLATTVLRLASAVRATHGAQVGLHREATAHNPGTPAAHAVFAAMASRVGAHAALGQWVPGLPAQVRREGAAMARAVVTATNSAETGMTAPIAAVRLAQWEAVAKARAAPLRAGKVRAAEARGLTGTTA